jgi:hypothetical protein
LTWKGETKKQKEKTFLIRLCFGTAVRKGDEEPANFGEGNQGSRTGDAGGKGRGIS